MKEFTGEIRVKWLEGYLIVDRGLAFPASADWLKTFLKVVRLDWREVEILEDLAEYLEFNANLCESEARRREAMARKKIEAKEWRSRAKRYASNLKTVRKRLEVIR